MNMIQKVKKTIDRHRMLDDGDTIIVALSGGADSCALLSIMAEVQMEYHLKIVVAHFNHGLRADESVSEEEYCRHLASTFKLPFESGTMSSLSVPKGESPEGYYRKERYHFLDHVAQLHHAKKIALGHHLNDQAETVLINILRGSGIEGIKGILPVRQDRYIRPMIDISREEILAYLEQKELKYCNDSSNQHFEYLRNRIRLELMPILKEKFNPKIEQALARMAQTLRRDHEYLEGDVQHIIQSEQIRKTPDVMAFSVEYFTQLPEAMRYRLVKALLEGMIGEGTGIYHSHIQSVVDLAQAGSTGRSISLPSGFIAINDYDNILIKKRQNADTGDYQYSLSIPGTIDLKERSIIISAKEGRLEDIDFGRKDAFYFDFDAIEGPLILRNRRCGDWFVPLGTSGRQKIKKLLIDHKISRAERKQIALMSDNVSVLWIENTHLCDRVKITSGTRRVLILEISTRN